MGSSGTCHDDLGLEMYHRDINVLMHICSPCRFIFSYCAVVAARNADESNDESKFGVAEQESSY